jgi:DNA-binding GntR family transcriptional regulator
VRCNGVVARPAVVLLFKPLRLRIPSGPVKQNMQAAVPESAAPVAAPQGQKTLLHNDAAQILRNMILSGELAPGERLREISISKQLGMSRTPIREAFRTLAAEGLVDLLPNRSVLVSELDKGQAEEVFVVLGALEALAAELACQNMTVDQMEYLAELQDDLRRHFLNSDRRSYLQANRMIHAHIVDASRNQSLILAWRLLLPRAERARQISTRDHGRWAEAYGEHGKIFSAIVARDVALVKRLMAEHFANGVLSMKKSEREQRAIERLQAYAAAGSKTKT